MPFISYFLAFISPISWFIVVIEVVMVAELIFNNLVYRMSSEPPPVESALKDRKLLSWKKVLLTTGLYVWLIIMLRIVELAFMNDTPILSKIVAGYITWNHVKQLIKNIDVYSGSNLWGQIEGTINKIKI